jgi:hypothetical protein
VTVKSTPQMSSGPSGDDPFFFAVGEFRGRHTELGRDRSLTNPKDAIRNSVAIGRYAIPGMQQSESNLE